MVIDKDINSMYPNTRPKFPNPEWRWDYHPVQQRWETYCHPHEWPYELFQWLWATFGHPGTDPESGNQCEHSGWDYHGGWIYLYREDYLALFKLRWS